jgi:glycosyltransferase involved in cell wall biosynthesis
MSGNNDYTILFINHWAADLGGAEYSLIDIIEHATTRATTYLITTENGELVRRVTALKCTAVIVPCIPNIVTIKRKHFIRTLFENWKGVVAFLQYVVTVKKHLHSIHPDCIHSNVPKSHITLFLLKLLGYRGRCIIHMREIFNGNGAVVLLYRLLFRLAGSVDVIAISNAVCHSLPMRMRRSAKVIYNGVTISCEKVHFTDTPPIKFLYLGRIVPWKGCDLLVNAFEKTLRQSDRTKASLTIVGDTSYWDCSYRTALIELINKSGVAASIHLRDKTDTPLDVLLQHDVLCLPSKDEPFGRVAAEAQGSCMPVIGFSCGGLPEVVIHEKTGLLVPNQDTDALAEAMLRFIDHPSLISQMGICGRERTLVLFDKHRQMPKIINRIMGIADETF